MNWNRFKLALVRRLLRGTGYGLHKLPPPALPPQHVNCRCIVQPITEPRNENSR